MNRTRRSFIVVWIISAIVSAGPAWAQRLGGGDDDGIAVWRVAGAIMVVLVMGGLAIFFGKARPFNLRVWTPAADRRIRIIETARMSPHSVLCLAALDGREYLIAVTPASASVIDVRPDKVSV